MPSSASSSQNRTLAISLVLRSTQRARSSSPQAARKLTATPPSRALRTARERRLPSTTWAWEARDGSDERRWAGGVKAVGRSNSSSDEGGNKIAERVGACLGLMRERSLGGSLRCHRGS